MAESGGSLPPTAAPAAAPVHTSTFQRPRRLKAAAAVKAATAAHLRGPPKPVEEPVAPKSGHRRRKREPAKQRKGRPRALSVGSSMAAISLGGSPGANPVQSPGGGWSLGSETGGRSRSVSFSVGGTRRKGKGTATRWSKVEDQALITAMNSLGSADGRSVRWSAVAELLPGRIGKQARERWFNHLDPELKKGPWTAHEDRVLISSQLRLGNRWCEIAKLLPGRSDNAIKNRWHSSARKRRQGEVMMHAAANPGSAFDDAARAAAAVQSQRSSQHVSDNPPIRSWRGGEAELERGLIELAHNGLFGFSGAGTFTGSWFTGGSFGGTDSSTGGLGGGDAGSDNEVEGEKGGGSSSTGLGSSAMYSFGAAARSSSIGSERSLDERDAHDRYAKRRRSSSVASSTGSEFTDEGQQQQQQQHLRSPMQQQQQQQQAHQAHQAHHQHIAGSSAHGPSAPPAFELPSRHSFGGNASVTKGGGLGGLGGGRGANMLPPPALVHHHHHHPSSSTSSAAASASSATPSLSITGAASSSASASASSGASPMMSALSMGSRQVGQHQQRQQDHDHDQLRFDEFDLGAQAITLELEQAAARDPTGSILARSGRVMTHHQAVQQQHASSLLRRGGGGAVQSRMKPDRGGMSTMQQQQHYQHQQYRQLQQQFQQQHAAHLVARQQRQGLGAAGAGASTTASSTTFTVEPPRSIYQDIFELIAHGEGGEGDGN